MNDMPPVDFPPAQQASLSIAEGMLALGESFAPVFTAAKAMRERLEADGWGEDTARSVAFGYMMFWVNVILEQAKAGMVSIPISQPQENDDAVPSE